MGDLPPPSGASAEYTGEDGVPTGQPPPHPPSQGHSGTPYPTAPYYSGQQPAFLSQLDMSQSQALGRGNHNPTPYDMRSVGNALPQQQRHYPSLQYSQRSQQRFDSHAMSPPPSQPQYETQNLMHPMANQQQYYHGQHQYYPTPVSPPYSQASLAARNNMGYYPNQTVMNPQAPAAYYYPQQSHYGTPPPNSMPGHFVQGHYMSPTLPQADPRMAAAMPTDHYGTFPYSPSPGPPTSSENPQNKVRGPPRKPKQSGHAIWIGNLPPQTELMTLVHHVCQEAPGLESLFLISKSNCAFANFQDAASCITAQQKLHDSTFGTVRLVSRLRKNTVEGASGVAAPTGPAAIVSHSRTSSGDAHPRTDGANDSNEETPNTCPATEGQTGVPTITGDGGETTRTTTPGPKDKFFILKSLTLEDLQLSVQTGIWATQSHNEEVLNKAFSTADNVYLVFSANKSGEYFGYARMLSPINDDPAAAIEFAPKAQEAATDVNLPKAIPTEATEFAPKGRIIDDSARGTIFWEAEREENNTTATTATNNNNTLEIPGQEGGSGEEGGNSTGDDSSVRSTEGGSSKGEENKAWGKPFKLEWLSTTKLPFYRARGLRNPWNSNREVKIARDGTELEPAVGRRLISLFNRAAQTSPLPPVAAMRGGGGPPMPMVAGYPQIRPPYQS